MKNKQAAKTRIAAAKNIVRRNDKAFLDYDKKNKKYDAIIRNLLVVYILCAIIAILTYNISAIWFFGGGSILVIIAWFIWFAIRYYRFILKGVDQIEKEKK